MGLTSRYLMMNEAYYISKAETIGISTILSKRTSFIALRQ